MAARSAPIPSPFHEPRASERPPIARLAALHREASETARLANLLGRAPRSGAGLAVATVATLIFSSASLAREISWGVLMVFAVGAIAVSYRRAIVAPFAREPLLHFAENLKAILFYAGFAWGSGAFLVLPAGAGLAATAAFAIATSALVAMLVREARIASFFVAPVCLVSALAVPVRPLPEAIAAAPLVLLAWGLLAGAMFGLDRLRRHDERLPQIPELA